MNRLLLAAAAACAAFGASAQTSIGLQNFQVTGNYALDALGGIGLEASAVTYARDRGTLFFVGDEAKAVVEISRTGVTLGSMAFSGWGGTTTSDPGNDAEGLTYLGNGVLVVTEERLQDAFRFSYTSGGSINLGTAPSASLGATIGNVGIEGISYDRRDGSFAWIKQDNPAALSFGNLSFAVGGGSASNVTSFGGSASVFGLNSLSDVQTLSSVDAFAGRAAADNLLVLSLESKRLIEINRMGQTLSSLDLSGITGQPIEGVTIDENGVLYLVAEQGTSGNSRLFVLTSTAPIPEPGTYALMLGGLALLGWRARRKA